MADTCPLLFLAGVLLGTPGDASPSHIDPAAMHGWRGLGNVVPVRLPAAGEGEGDLQQQQQHHQAGRPTIAPTFRLTPPPAAGALGTAPVAASAPPAPYSAFMVTGRDRAVAGLLAGSRDRVPGGGAGVGAPTAQPQVSAQHGFGPTAVTSVLPPAPARAPLKRGREAGPSSGDYEAVRGPPVRARGAGPMITHVVTVDGAMVGVQGGSAAAMKRALAPPQPLSHSTSPPPVSLYPTPTPATPPTQYRGVAQSDDETVCCGLCGAGYKNGDKWRQVRVGS
jgi:hypothetical protein